MNQPHRDMDDTADFAMSRFHPAESCTELGADPDRIGCGPNGSGAGPIEWLCRGLLALLLIVLAALLVAGVA
jgi:hypothetical protein